MFIIIFVVKMSTDQMFVSYSMKPMTKSKISSLPSAKANEASREKEAEAGKLVKILDVILVLGEYFISPDTQKYTRYNSATLTVTNLWS